MRIFVTHIMPRDKVLKYRLSVAACNFSHNLIEGGGFDKVYSILPTFVTGEIEQFEGLIYSRFRKKRFFKSLAPLVENIKLFCFIPRNSSVWYYNCTILNALLIILLGIFKPSVKQQIILLDYTPSKRPLDCFFLWLSNKMRGTIRLANSPLFKVKNSVCLPGVVPDNSKKYPTIESIDNSFLISGVLEENIAMLSMLLDAFSKMPELTIHITGVLSDKETILQYNNCPNIIFHGQVQYDEYLQILHSIPFLLSCRNPMYPENQCNFPSKIIESLLHNRIIISTIHYPQLEGIKYFEVNSNVENFIHDIRHIIAMPKSDLLQYANQSRIVRSRFNTKVWYNTMDKIEMQEL